VGSRSARGSTKAVYRSDRPTRTEQYLAGEPRQRDSARRWFVTPWRYDSATQHAQPDHTGRGKTVRWPLVYRVLHTHAQHDDVHRTLRASACREGAAQLTQPRRVLRGGSAGRYRVFLARVFRIEKWRLDPAISGILPVDLYYMPFTHSLIWTPPVCKDDSRVLA